MRPVSRGDCPTDEHGQPKQFSHYREARPDLVDRLGFYCSYCELPLKHAPHVEHVRPKTCRPDLVTAWGNLLLGCVNCNSCKGDQDVALHNYYWPDLDNTMRAFAYGEGGAIAPHSELSAGEEARARRTLDLVGLQRPESPTDLRQFHRSDAWHTALRSRANLREADSEAMRQEITSNARGQGFFSVWMTVFRQDTDMLRRFIEALPGTATDCFDDACCPVPRPGGAL